jgi:citrate lyase subunit beta / citryl-CoA lyase
MTPALHPQHALFDTVIAAPCLPVCDHYAGTEARMRKSLALQADMGPVFDVTLDCEDGAPIGGEAEQAHCVAELALSSANQHGRVGARVHTLDHPAFAQDISTLVGRAGGVLAYLMLPKPQGLTDVQRACAAIDQQLHRSGITRPLPVHVLIETHGALREVALIAAHPRVESLSFGLMDFVSAHHGAIPASAMTAPGQFSHPLVRRAKLEIAASCHEHGKTPSHCVVTEFADVQATSIAATQASREYGYTRMWSIHPQQIQLIIDAFSPSADEVEQAFEIISAAQAAQWAPIRHRVGLQSTLQDRASYRYHWQVLVRAHRTGQHLPAGAKTQFFTPALAP